MCNVLLCRLVLLFGVHMCSSCDLRACNVLCFAVLFGAFVWCASTCASRAVFCCTLVLKTGHVQCLVLLFGMYVRCTCNLRAYHVLCFTVLVGGPACILRAMFCCISSIDSLMSSHAQVVHLPFGGLDLNCGPPWLYVIVKRAQVYQTPFVLCTSLAARRVWLHNWTVIVKSVLVR